MKTTLDIKTKLGTQNRLSLRGSHERRHCSIVLQRLAMHSLHAQLLPASSSMNLEPKYHGTYQSGSSSRGSLSFCFRRSRKSFIFPLWRSLNNRVHSVRYQKTSPKTCFIDIQVCLLKTIALQLFQIPHKTVDETTFKYTCFLFHSEYLATNSKFWKL